MSAAYTCARCGAAAVVRDGAPVERRCEHADAAVIAHCAAVVTGHVRFGAGRSLLERVRAALRGLT